MIYEVKNENNETIRFASAMDLKNWIDARVLQEEARYAEPEEETPKQTFLLFEENPPEIIHLTLRDNGFEDSDDGLVFETKKRWGRKKLKRLVKSLGKLYIDKIGILHKRDTIEAERQRGKL